MLNLILSIGLLLGTSLEDVKDLSVDASASQVKWEGGKVGSTHYGTIDLKSGNLVIENGVLKGGNFVLDMATIKNTDLSEDYQPKLEGHLKSDDFFGVANYPTSKLDITKVVSQGGGQYKVTANITIKETTKEIKFLTSVEDKGTTYEATANLTIDRSEFDVKYGSGSFFDDLGDKVIYDDFKIDVKVIAAK